MWELLGNDTDFLNSLEDILDVTLGKVGDSVGDLNFETLSVFEALLDLWKIVLLEEAIQGSGDELLGTFDVHLVVSGNDACGGLNEFHCLLNININYKRNPEYFE